MLGVDRDTHKIAMIQKGQSPFFEPGLTDLVARNVGNKRLTAGALDAAAIAAADVILLCVGTTVAGQRQHRPEPAAPRV